MTETDLQSELDKLQDFPRHAGGGTGGSITKLRKRNPIPEFDDHIQFFDWCVVKAGSGRLVGGLECDSEGDPLVWTKVTRHCKERKPVPFSEYTILDHVVALQLADGTVDRNYSVKLNWEEILNHKYFVDGRMMDGSMTGFLHTLSKPYDSEANLRRISQSPRILMDKNYKYYHVGLDDLRQMWPALVEDSEGELLSELDSYLSYHGTTLPSFAAFRSAYEEVAYEAIKKQWADITEKACKLGHAMHFSIEMFYNDMYDPTLPRFQTPAFLRFLRFHHEWVLARDLVPYRTELCMFTERAELCGTIDMLFQRRCDVGDPFRKHNVIMVDWKRSKEIKTQSFDKGDNFFPPLQMLPNCNLSDYTCQTNGYTVLLHEKTELRVTERHIAVFHPDYPSYQLFELPDVVEQMAACIDKRRVDRMKMYRNEKKRSIDEAELYVERAGSDSEPVRLLQKLIGIERKMQPLLDAEIEHASKKARKSRLPSMFRKQ